ncbi:receptor-type tyrosine-protein phosphatase S-like [Haliotis cracherodii]|uniref:receptor-type tyrosine-protein phosphatase S-like n=1 Tax=Haliotis cracherodii TaxID=6455 RepID=UPI0039ED989F
MYENLTNDTCPDAITGKRCNTAVGRCEYDCDDLTFCDNFHMMKITVEGGKDAVSESMCRQIKTTDYIQPGPVRALRVTAINSTALRVSWKKPDDRLRSLGRRYTYSVTYLTGLKNVKKIKTKDEDVEAVLTDLEPWTNYTVTVTSRPRRKGFRGPPQKATNATLEDVPASGPVIPESAYSRVAPGVLGVYWSSVPRNASRGVIVNYSVQASCCLSRPLFTTDHSTTVNITGHSNLTVLVNAATRNGWSDHPSQLHVYRRDLGEKYYDIFGSRLKGH